MKNETEAARVSLHDCTSILLRSLEKYGTIQQQAQAVKVINATSKAMIEIYKLKQLNKKYEI